MMVVLNPYAGGGTAEEKWRCVRDALPLHGPLRVCTLGNGINLSNLVRHALCNGERDFIAAGGDGTLNALVNALVPSLSCLQRDQVRCGAVGLGSSNDFHKPLENTRMIGGIPCKVDLAEARPRDVGVVRYLDGRSYRERLFLINASIGITAEANDFFNHPDLPLGLLKRVAPAAAILYAAVRTIVGYRNRRMVVTTRADRSDPVAMTNLALVKSPHVSGGLHYNCLPGYTSGSFNIYSCTNLGIMGRFGLLRRLSRGQFKEDERCRAWSAPDIEVHARNPFKVEIDGEVVTTQYVRFSILPYQLMVCP